MPTRHGTHGTQAIQTGNFSSSGQSGSGGGGGGSGLILKKFYLTVYSQFGPVSNLPYGYRLLTCQEARQLQVG